ncbi:MAG: glycosyltransferase [Actinobacteria bacterium]|nr:glycosyltransferase [Actinomycetota bacterium]
MKVLANVMYAKVGGGLSYACNQVSALAREPDVDVELLVSPWNEEAFRTLGAVSDDALHLVKVPNVPTRFAWEQFVLPRWAARRGFDVVLNSGNFAPLVCGVPNVMVLQNPNFVGDGRIRAAGRGLPYRAKIGLSVAGMRRADAVVSVSDTLTEAIGSEPDLRHIDVVTVRSAGPPVEPDEIDRSAVTGLVGPDPYLVSVANDYPHKRLEDLGALVARLADSTTAVPARVVLVGDIAEDRRAAIRARAGEHADRLVFLGSVGDRPVVSGLYRHAFAAVVTSEMESWGLTLPEAGARSCPVVATDLPAHREVAGDHVRYVEPGDLDAFVSALEAIVDEPRPAPWDIGRTWEDHGRELAAALRDVVDARRAG